MDNEQTTPSVDDLTAKSYSTKEWLTYYLNVWSRNLVARAIDVEHDKRAKLINPEEIVLESSPDGRLEKITVKERLENRKIMVSDALNLVKSIEGMLSYLDTENSDENIFWGKTALKVDGDMIQPKPGDTCKTPNGENGTWQPDGKGLIMCIPNEKVEVITENKTQDPESKV